MSRYDDEVAFWMTAIEMATEPYLTECPECGVRFCQYEPFCTACHAANEHPGARKVLTLDEAIKLGSRYTQ